MASETAASCQIFQNWDKNSNGFSQQEIEFAIAKAVELRALHAALTRGNSPADSRFPSPASRPVSQFSAKNYPIYTPSYEDEALHGYGISKSWDENGTEGDDENAASADLSDYKKEISISRRSRFSPGFLPSESQNSSAQSHKSQFFSGANTISLHQTSPGSEIYNSIRRNNFQDFKSASSRNRFKSSESESVANSVRIPNTMAPMTDSHLSFQPKSKSRSVISWFFPKLKKNHKVQNSPPCSRRAESEQVSQFYNELGIVSVEKLKRELFEANSNRDKALKEVFETKSSLTELKQKLERLESYCKELKNAVKHQKNPQFSEMPFSAEVMVEGFLQIVSEARSSVKQFSQNLIRQIDDKDNILTENLNSLLQQYKLSLNPNSKHSKMILYHFEAIINQSFYQDFENSSFQKNGAPTFLDPLQDRQGNFSSFVALRNLSWDEVQKRGTKFYSDGFSKFCDQKMSLIITKLNWIRPWSENLLQGFFVAAKCVWLVHLLAFSFNPALGILRVEENRGFDGKFMEDLFVERCRGEGGGNVKVMVMPGFYVQDKVLRCKVVCSRYKS